MQFDNSEPALVYQEHTADGEKSNCNLLSEVGLVRIKRRRQMAYFTWGSRLWGASASANIGNLGIQV